LKKKVNKPKDKSDCTDKKSLKKIVCCKSGCQDCPFNFKKECDPNVAQELNDNWSNFSNDENMSVEELEKKYPQYF